MLSFKVLFYPLNICNASTFYKHGASGSSSDTIVVAQSSLQHGVINNAKRKWQTIDKTNDFNTRFSQTYMRDFTRLKGAANLNI
jgi:hypothetical protein